MKTFQFDPNFNFDNWECRASAVDKLMTANKNADLTEMQKIELDSLLSKVGKFQELTINQLAKYESYKLKESLSQNQQIEFDKWEAKMKLPLLSETKKEEMERLIIKRDSPPELSKTTQTHCKNVMKSELFGRRKEIKGAQLEKGTKAEEDSITLFCEVKDCLQFKNEKHFSNGIIKGTPDLVLPEEVPDIKSSWSLDTYPMIKDDPGDYHLQVKSYCILTNKPYGSIAYCLVDAPPEMVDDALRSLVWQHKATSIDSVPIEAKVKCVTNMIFTEKGMTDYLAWNLNMESSWFGDFIAIPDYLRLREFNVDILDEDFKNITRQVKLAREYMNSEYRKIMNIHANRLAT